VQKQYKTALNHLLKIDDAKKELANTVNTIDGLDGIHLLVSVE
jgi:hypothetical protein